jgi:hypothetical protein
MISPIYWHPILYEYTMRLLYGRHFMNRYRAIADAIPDGITLLEICAGDFFLYRRFLHGRRLSYKGTDRNEVFIRSAKKRGINASRLELPNDPVPQADVILMQASLYHFIPHHKAIIDKMLASAHSSVIIAEPISNVTSSGNAFLSRVSSLATDPGTGPQPQRFTRSTLSAFFHSTYANHIVRESVIAGNHEVLYVLRPTP